MDEVYISQWDALQCFEDWEDSRGRFHWAHEDRTYQRIEELPPADVQPVVHGSWIVTDHGDYQLIECDQCHAQMWNHQSELPNYCYECGADMRKVVEIDQVKEGAE